MLGLTDDLNQFDKLARQNDLDKIVTVSQGFQTGTVHVKDMVNENHKVIEEFKKMKNVFINYTKLTRKILDQITQHEVTVGSNAIKLGNLTNFIEKKIEGVLGQMKNIYEDTMVQNTKSITAMEELIQPINQQLKTKVDAVSYNKHMEQIVSAIGGNEGGQDDSSQVHRGDDEVQFSVDRVISKAKKSKLGMQSEAQLQLFEQVDEKNQLICLQIQDLEKRFQQEKDFTKRTAENLNVVFNQAKDRMRSIQQQKQREVSGLNGQVKKLCIQLQTRTSQSVFDNLKYEIINYFNQRLLLMQHQVGDIKSRASNTDQSNRVLFEQVEKRAQQLAGEMQEHDEYAHATQGQLENFKVSFSRYKLEAEENAEDFRRKFNYQLDEVKASQTKIKREADRLKAIIQNLEKSFQEQSARLVQKRMKEGFSIIYSGIEGLKHSEREAKTKMIEYEQAISDIRQVVARKANYNDYLHQFDKKADKGDFIGLKQQVASMELDRKQPTSMPGAVFKPSTAAQSRVRKSRRSTGGIRDLKQLKDFSPKCNTFFNLSRTEQLTKSKESNWCQKKLQMKAYSTRLQPSG